MMTSTELYEHRRRFAKAIARYLWRLNTQSPIISTTQRDYRTLCELFGHGRVEAALEAHWNRYTHRVLRQEPKLFCEQWDSQYSHDPYPIIEIGAEIKEVGSLQSQDYEAVAAAAGIQDHSKRL